MSRNTYVRLCLLLLSSLLVWTPVHAQRDTCDPNEDYSFISGNAYSEGDYEAALAAANCLVELSPDDAYGYALQGDAYRELGDPNAALDAYTTAIEISPDYDGAYVARANVQIDLGNFEAAIEDATAAIEISPTYAYAYVLRGDALSDLGEYETAISDYDEAILNSASYNYAYVQRGAAYYETGDVETALADLEEAIAIDSTYSYAYSTRARIYAGIEEYDTAIDDYSAAIDLNTIDSNRLNYIERAIIYGRVGDDAAALDDLFKFTQLYPEGVIDARVFNSSDSDTVDMCEGCIFAFTVQVGQGESFSISASDIDPQLTVDPLLVILDPNGIPVAVDDDSGDVWGSELEFEARDSGIHTIYVTHAYAGTQGRVGIVIEALVRG